MTSPAQRPDLEAGGSPLPAASETPPRVLIVDDEADNRDLLVRRLHARGFSPVAVEGGKAALEALIAEPFDLVLLDYMMPGMSGREALDAIRARWSSAELPVVFCTAVDDKAAMVDAFRAGANDYVVKPIDFQLLSARLATQLRLRTAFKQAVEERVRLERRLAARSRLEARGQGCAQNREAIMSDLRRGLKDGAVSLHYQPQFHIRAGRIASAEALVRWTSPVFGPMAPSDFITLAEDSNDIFDLTLWTVRQALKDHALLQRRGLPLEIAVNLSASVASDPGFIDILLDLVRERPEDLTFELTESAIFNDPEGAITQLRRFADAGVRVAIDDYGSGMSSLAYLQRLPISELKIDRMFISALTQSHRDPLIVRSTIELAHALDLKVVAEGVECAEALALLSVMGCDVAQGYFISRPIGFDAFVSFVDSNPRDLAPSPDEMRARLRQALLAGNYSD